eukprot:3452208-Amphidinium_carterae.1
MGAQRVLHGTSSATHLSVESEAHTSLPAGAHGVVQLGNSGTAIVFQYNAFCRSRSLCLHQTIQMSRNMVT